MKMTIRPMTFETNSSSTHSLVFCTPEQYARFQNGELLYFEYPYGNIPSKSFVTEEEVRQEIDRQIASGDEDADKSQQDVFERLLDWRDARRYCDYGEELEFFMERWTTPGGEDIVVFGEYGHD